MMLKPQTVDEYNNSMREEVAKPSELVFKALPTCVTGEALLTEPSSRGESLPSFIMAVAMPHSVPAQIPFIPPFCLFASCLDPSKTFSSLSFKWCNCE